MSRLSIELVPSTAWWTNVRSNVTRAQWEICKEYTRQKSGGVCEICGGRGPKWATEAHEVWHYDDLWEAGDRPGRQTLVDLIALCPDCHSTKHIGHSKAMGLKKFERAFNHLCAVNGWTPEHAERYVINQFKIWEIRSNYPWELDISFLSMLGIDITVKGSS